MPDRPPLRNLGEASTGPPGAPGDSMVDGQPPRAGAKAG